MYGSNMYGIKRKKPGVVALCRFICILAVVFSGSIFCIFYGVRAVSASEAEYTELYTYEDLLLMVEEPEGSYILMQDIDLGGRKWKPVDFSGSFDGNGYALLNVTVTELSDTTVRTYDGNMKEYETYVAGFFGVLEEASVSNLKLINYKAEVTAEQPCFVGSIAGYSEDSSITDCDITAYIRLDAHDRMFGVGGIVGYGNGRLEGTQAEVCLVCNDTDSENRDEQFMGGAYGAGYFDLDGCNIAIDGYASEHGYAHNGGVAGLYMLYPAGTVYEGYLTNTRVTGKISFYEDNTDRRAYCKDFIGEVMNWTYRIGGNSSDFVRDESYDYSVVLMPHTCAVPSYTSEQISAGCESFGYELYRCQLCGYEYTDNYTARVHEVFDWQTIREPSFDEGGMEEGVCTLCGNTVRRTTDKLEEPETTGTTEAAESISEPEKDTAGPAAEADLAKAEEENISETGKGTKTDTVYIVFILLAIIATIWVIFAVFRRIKKR